MSYEVVKMEVLNTVLHDEHGVWDNKSQLRETAKEDPVRLRDEILEAAGAKSFP